jgi:integrator complex subunit 6
MASLDQLIQRIHGGVVINFEKVGPDPPVIIPNEDELQNNSESNKESFVSNSMNGLINSNNNNNSNNLSNSNNNININDIPCGTKAWHSTRKLIYVQRSAQKGYSVGHWPIPESFWPDLSCPSLQPRTAHPIVKFTCANSEPAVIENLPFDKYELEPSPLTQFILSRKQPSVAWQVYVSNSHKNSELGLPFGYLKASTTLTCVNLFVLPYNYPILLPLLEDLFKVHQGKPTREWKVQFDNYLKIMPLYYASPLKRALQRMGAPNLVPDNMENCLSYPVLNYLKRLKNTAKAEYEKLVASVGTAKPQVICEGVRVLNNASYMRKISEHGFCSNPLLSQRFANLKNELNEFSGFVIRFRNNHLVGSKTQCYRNAYDISRHELLDQIFRMRTNFLQKHTSSIRYQDEDQIHSLPISQMGNYQEYLKRMPLPLRELESIPVRQHMFGNPFKIDKRGMMMIDEADIDLVGNGSGGSSPVRVNKRSANDIYLGGPKPKRKPGPLPKDFPLQRPCSPSPPPASPLPQPLSPLSPPLSPILTNPLPSSSLQTTTPSLKETVKSVANGNLSAARNKDLTSQTVPNNLLTNSETSKVVIIPPKTWAKDLAPERTNSPLIPNSSQLSNTVCVPNEQTIDSEVKLNNHIDRENEIELISELTPKPEVEFSSINNLNVNNSSISVRNVNSRTNAPTYMPVNGRIVNSDSSQSSTLTNHVDHNGTDNNLNNKRFQFTAEEFELKRYLFKLVRKPGRSESYIMLSSTYLLICFLFSIRLIIIFLYFFKNLDFDELLRELSHIKGSLGDYLLQEVIAEANRFKRKSLIQVLSTQFGRSHDISGLETLRAD